MEIKEPEQDDGVKRFDIWINKTGKPTIHPKNQKTAPVHKTGQDAWFYMGMMGEIGFSIALPIVGGAIIGSSLDRYYHLYPKATLSGLGLGIVVSVLSLVYTVRTILENERKKYT